MGGGARVVDDAMGGGTLADGGCGAFDTRLIDTVSKSPFLSIVTVSVTPF